MVILTQDKKMLVNFNNLITIEFHAAAKLVGYCKNQGYMPIPLGEYPTEERALEVLKEIYDCFNYSYDGEIRGDGYTNYNLTVNIPKDCYEMPEK